MAKARTPNPPPKDTEDMVWTQKASAPATINVGDAFAALITGDAQWGWLVNWIPLLPPETIQTADLCALGPSTTPGLSFGDFVAPMGMDAGQIMAHQIELANKLRTTMYDRLFGAYCELVAGATTGCGPPLSGWVSSGGWITLAIPSNTVDIKVGNGTGGNVQESRRSSLNNTGGINWGYALNASASGADQLIHWSQTASGETPPHTEQFCCIRVNSFMPSFIEFCGTLAGTTGHTPTPQPQPAGVIPPPTRTYPDIASLGAELDRQELKLEVILSTLQTMATRTVVGPTTTDPPADAAAGPLIQPSAIGFRIDVANIPASADEAFGTPPRYHRLGRVTLGSANGWLPAFELQQNPQIVAPLPPGIDRIQVVCHPPATATITALRPT